MNKPKFIDIDLQSPLGLKRISTPMETLVQIFFPHWHEEHHWSTRGERASKWNILNYLPSNIWKPSVQTLGYYATDLSSTLTMFTKIKRHKQKQSFGFQESASYSMVATFRQFLKYFQILYAKDFASKYKNIPKFLVWFG